MIGRRVVCCLAGSCLFLHGITAAAGDWPQWGGRGNRNMVSDEKGLPDSFERGKKEANGSGIDLTTTKNVKWAARLGSAAYGNPTVADGRVYVGTDDLTVTDDPRFQRSKAGMVKCFEEATGKLLWQLVTLERTADLPQGALYTHQHLGTLSSPTVDGDRVYVVSSACEVLCLDVHGQANGNDGPFLNEGQLMVPPGQPAVTLQATDADILWRLDLIKDLDVCPHDAASCSILIHGDLLYLSTSNGVDNPHAKAVRPDAPGFIAVDKRTGRVVARENEDLSKRMWHCNWCSPSVGQIGDKSLIFLGGPDGLCYAFEALTAVPEQPVSLKKVWSYDCNPPAYRLRDGQPIEYYAGDKRKSTSPNKDDGAYCGPSEVIGTPVFHNNRIYVAIGQDPAHGRGRGLFHCIDATKTGDITETGRLWTYDGLDRSIATAAVAEGLVYITDIAGRLHCLDADTGRCYWVHETKAETWGGVLVADGKLFFGTKKAFWIMAVGKTPKVLSENHLGSPVYSTPIAANGVLYAASQQYLWAIAQPASTAEKQGQP
ncbi:MAG: PQQ-binding-like beta-propeller repeat protein [Planctomycetota bacterium]|nr:PQQ-binding-like beta-propeller repeat protein [Planctomycetota bacterium]